MVFNKSKKGAQGIGTLIIFIAMILVAAVAAGVLIKTVADLQGKAENTGTEIQQRLGTGFSVVEVTTKDTSDSYINESTDTFHVTVRLAPGSDAVKLSDITVTQVTQNGMNSYSYNDSALTGNSFNVSAVSGDYVDGYIDGTDVFTISFQSSATVAESEEFTIRLFPGAGSPQPIQLVTPPSMVTTYTVLK